MFCCYSILCTFSDSLSRRDYFQDYHLLNLMLVGRLKLQCRIAADTNPLNLKFQSKEYFDNKLELIFRYGCFFCITVATLFEERCSA